MAVNPQLAADFAFSGTPRHIAPPSHDVGAPLQLLLISDDTQLRALLSHFLAAHHYSVTAVVSASTRAQSIAGWDAAIVDAGNTQLEALRSLRGLDRKEGVPTVAIAMTRIASDTDTLRQRVDVVLDKPLDPRKLLLVLRGLFVGRSKPAPRDQEALTAGPFTLQCLLNTLTVETREITLTGFETRILRELMLAASTPVARNRLALCASARARSRDDRSLDTHVKRLRRKIGADRHGRTPIRTVRGIGYLLLTDWQPHA
jgi:DNA-binding response OmpR family regulator